MPAVSTTPGNDRSRCRPRPQPLIPLGVQRQSTFWLLCRKVQGSSRGGNRVGHQVPVAGQRVTVTQARSTIEMGTTSGLGRDPTGRHRVHISNAARLAYGIGVLDVRAPGPADSTYPLDLMLFGLKRGADRRMTSTARGSPRKAGDKSYSYPGAHRRISVRSTPLRVCIT